MDTLTTKPADHGCFRSRRNKSLMKNGLNPPVASFGHLADSTRFCLAITGHANAGRPAYQYDCKAAMRSSRLGWLANSDIVMLFLIQRLSHIVQSDWRNTGLRHMEPDKCPANGRAFVRGVAHLASTPLPAWYKPHTLTP